MTVFDVWEENGNIEDLKKFAGDVGALGAGCEDVQDPRSKLQKLAVTLRGLTNASLAADQGKVELIKNFLAGRLDKHSLQEEVGGYLVPSKQLLALETLEATLEIWKLCESIEKSVTPNRVEGAILEELTDHFKLVFEAMQLFRGPVKDSLPDEVSSTPIAIVGKWSQLWHRQCKISEDESISSITQYQNLTDILRLFRENSLETVITSVTNEFFSMSVLERSIDRVFLQGSIKFAQTMPMGVCKSIHRANAYANLIDVEEKHEQGVSFGIIEKAKMAATSLTLLQGHGGEAVKVKVFNAFLRWPDGFMLWMQTTSCADWQALFEELLKAKEGCDKGDFSECEWVKNPEDHAQSLKIQRLQHMNAMAGGWSCIHESVLAIIENVVDLEKEKKILKDNMADVNRVLKNFDLTKQILGTLAVICVILETPRPPDFEHNLKETLHYVKTQVGQDPYKLTPYVVQLIKDSQAGNPAKIKKKEKADSGSEPAPEKAAEAVAAASAPSAASSTVASAVSSGKKVRFRSGSLALFDGA